MAIKKKAKAAPSQSLDELDLDAQLAIDAQFGLEPIFEPGRDPRLVSLSASHRIRCPYCGERNEIAVESIYGSQIYQEDCQICCQTMTIKTEVANGEVLRVSAHRSDDVL
jgi:propanediol dehydratase small subunit